MLLSLAVIFLCGMGMGAVFRRLNLPQLLGMLLTGILLGPYALNLLDGSILSISADLRQIALIIILTRAGLNLDVEDLKKVGRAAVLMCFVPASFEILGMLALAPRILGISLLDAAIMGTVVAAVSPAVIVPKMLKLMEERYGTGRASPVDYGGGVCGRRVCDRAVHLLHRSGPGRDRFRSGSAADSHLHRPWSGRGSTLRPAAGPGLPKDPHARQRQGDHYPEYFLPAGDAGTLPERSAGLLRPAGGHGHGHRPAAAQGEVAARLSAKYSKLWVAAELLLFVLVGATVDVGYALASGGAAVLLIFGVLVFRMAGVFLCLLGTSLDRRERLFCMIAYMPKATVQAAIGAIPLSMGLACGQIVLTVAVLSILITAPLGSFLIERTYKKLLKPQEGRLASGDQL